MKIIEERICNCGTCHEAAEAAMRQVRQLLENQCPVWVWQIGASLTEMALAELLTDKDPDQRIAVQIHLETIGRSSILKALVDITLAEAGKDNAN